MLYRQLTRICYGKCHMKMPIGKSCRVVFMSCHIMSCHVTEGSHTEHCFVVKRFSMCVLKSSEFPKCLPIPRHPVLQMHSQQNKLHCSHRLFKAWMTLLSQTNCSWTEWQFSNKLFMNWPMQQPYQTSRTEWHCGHKQTVQGLNDTVVTNRLFMDWMTLQSQTDCSWTELWQCSHRLFMDWMTLLSPLQSQTDCSWTEWHCSHKQTVHGLTIAAATSDFMDWMRFSKHILSITHKIWDLRFSQQYH